MTEEHNLASCQDVARHEVPGLFRKGNTEFQETWNSIRAFAAAECPLLVCLSTMQTFEGCDIPCTLAGCKKKIVQCADIEKTPRVKGVNAEAHKIQRKIDTRRCDYAPAFYENMNKRVHPIVCALFLICDYAYQLCAEYCKSQLILDIIPDLIRKNEVIKAYCRQKDISTTPTDLAECARKLIELRQYLHSKLK